MHKACKLKSGPQEYLFFINGSLIMILVLMLLNAKKIYNLSMTSLLI